MTPNPFIVAILGAGAMASFALGLWMPAFLRYRELRRRIARFVMAGRPGGLAVDLAGKRRRQRVGVQRAAGRRERFLRYLAERIAEAQVELTPNEVIGAAGVCAALAAVAAFAFSGSVPLTACGFAIGGVAPLWWLHRQSKRLRGRFVSQLPDTVTLLASSIRAGHSLLQALEHVATEAPEPTRGAFALVVREIGLGAAQEDALERLAVRYPSEDIELIVAAINVHHQIGGSLTKVLDVIAETIRDRIRLAGDIRGLTAQQRYSAYVLSFLPPAVLFSLFVVSPDYMSVMFENAMLRAALIGAGVLIVAGFLAMRRVAAIDV